jgi:Cys-rich four helix bundle protein (predicted Tat secretion target)
MLAPQWHSRSCACEINNARKLMNRRDALVASAAFAAMSSTAFAQDHEHHARGAEPNRLAALAAECVRTGRACLDHCLESFGDASLAGCARAVDQMIPVAFALAKLASSNSSQVVPMARVALAVCQACETECRKHADTHETCRACAESCAKMIVECRQQIG